MKVSKGNRKLIGLVALLAIMAFLMVGAAYKMGLDKGGLNVPAEAPPKCSSCMSVGGKTVQWPSSEGGRLNLCLDCYFKNALFLTRLRMQAESAAGEKVNAKGQESISLSRQEEGEADKKAPDGVRGETSAQGNPGKEKE